MSEPPALVNFMLANCSPAPAAYEATILDLAAQGMLSVSAGPGGLLASLASPGATSQIGFEQRVLDDVRLRVRDVRDAPVEALAQACSADVQGIWRPFEEQLKAEARKRGLCGPRLRLRPAQGLAVTGAIAAGAVIASIVLGTMFSLGSGASAGIGIGLFIGSGMTLGWLCTADVLTAAGRARAACWSRARRGLATMAWAPAAASGSQVAPDRVTLRQCALAVATGVPVALPGYPARPGQRKGRAPYGPPGARQRPAQAWSSLSGEWRLVTIGTGNDDGLGMGGSLIYFGVAAWLAFIGWALSGPASAGPLPFALGLLIAAVLGALGLRRIVRLSAIPSRVTFDGQVIARWQEAESGENSSSEVYLIAVDDGQQAWVFTGQPVYDRVALGDLVKVTASPRTRSLAGLVVTGRAETATPRPAPWDTGPVFAG